MVSRRPRSPPPVRGLDECRETAAVGWHLAAGDNHRQPLELWAAFFCSADDHLCLGGHACPPAKRLDCWTMGRVVRGRSRWLHYLDEESSQAFRSITSDRLLLRLRRICLCHGVAV